MKGQEDTDSDDTDSDSRSSDSAVGRSDLRAAAAG